MVRVSGVVLLLVILELIFGARHHDGSWSGNVNPRFTTWTTTGKFRFFSLAPIYRLFVKLGTEFGRKLRQRRFDQETGTYPRVWSLKNLTASIPHEVDSNTVV